MKSSIKKMLFVTVAALNAQSANAQAGQVSVTGLPELSLKNLKEIHLDNNKVIQAKDVEGYYINSEERQPSIDSIVQVILKNGQTLDRREVKAIQSEGLKNLIPLEKYPRAVGVSVYVVKPIDPKSFRVQPQMWAE